MRKPGRKKIKPNVMTEPIRKVMKLTHVDLVEQGSELWFAPVEALGQILADAVKKPEEGGGKVSAGRAMLASVMLHTIKTGDPRKLDAILNRIVGRPAETIKLIGAFEGKQMNTIPVRAILENDMMAEKALHLAEFVSEKIIEHEVKAVTKNDHYNKLIDEATSPEYQEERIEQQKARNAKRK